jgi:cell division protein FtsQ
MSCLSKIFRAVNDTNLRKMKTKYWWIVGLIITIGVIAFAEMWHRNQLCKSLIVNLDQQAEYPFFNEQDIKNLANGKESLENTLLSKIDLKAVEERIEANRLIKKCQVSRDLFGNLLINIEQQRPIARLINTSSELNSTIYAGGRYLTDTGAVIPLSGRFTARTLLVSGVFFRNLDNLRIKNGKKLLELLVRINEDAFWKAQIAELQVDEIGEITVIPQVGQHTIEFGTADGYEEKFKKLKIFYKKILPVKGWEKYSKVSVKFRNQIVCQ